jgi:hypothetical protein
MNPSGKQKLRRVGGYPVYPLSIGGVGVEGEMPVLYNRMQTLILARPSKTLRKWWNWQTHHLEGVAPKGMRVQVPPSAPITYSASGDIYCLQPLRCPQRWFRCRERHGARESRRHAISQRQVEHNVLDDDKASQVGIKFWSSASDPRPPGQKPESSINARRKCVSVRHTVVGDIGPDFGEIKKGSRALEIDHHLFVSTALSA